MSRRSRAREAVLQVLYQDDLNTGRRLDPDEEFFRERLQQNDGLIEFAKELLRGVRLHRRELDAKLCLLYTSPSPRDLSTSRMPSSA